MTHDHAAAMQEIWVRHSELMRGHVADIQRFAEHMGAAGALRSSEYDSLKTTASEAAHALRGVLGTFGMPEGLQLVRQVESRLQREANVAAPELEELARCLSDIVEAGPAGAAATGR